MLQLLIKLRFNLVPQVGPDWDLGENDARQKQQRRGKDRAASREKADESAHMTAVGRSQLDHVPCGVFTATGVDHCVLSPFRREYLTPGACPPSRGDTSVGNRPRARSIRGDA